ncbi:MAG: hypothetical protein LPJ96_03560 [Exiguobacterium sp.]|uniref:DUF2004 domain-containing protein n=1 Tax=Exiguobacterium alkaliphilum TaxID=1428684 RepID=A0ABT2KTB6_9BACL|nr:MULTISPECIES: hypothetical protein [Exiguobacterium]MDX5322664.1 hypothetical protein [Exiguobacterium sp.]KDN59621.1 hypothetical protein DI14_10920 [Exiguobacterium sp. AB2]MCT4794197.1 hypothetical protein [Exiguobacterium alkaliphilum]MDX5424405.1 hypothetical protein [Exiguobacterium sp.]MDX6771909.1 hypothetical protein [Exiguobacterium sp.]
MTYEPLTPEHDLKVGDRISLKVDSAGESRDGFITEFEDAGFWIRFDDDIENEDFIDYRDSLLVALVSRPIDVVATHPELKPYEQLVTELQYRVYQGFTLEGIERTADGIDVHISLIEDGQTYTQTLRSSFDGDTEHVRYI